LHCSLQTNKVTDNVLLQYKRAVSVEHQDANPDIKVITKIFLSTRLLSLLVSQL